jgi:hypothetical protein
MIYTFGDYTVDTCQAPLYFGRVEDNVLVRQSPYDFEGSTHIGFIGLLSLLCLEDKPKKVVILFQYDRHNHTYNPSVAKAGNDSNVAGG